jgi:hypothetical protein
VKSTTELTFGPFSLASGHQASLSRLRLGDTIKISPVASVVMQQHTVVAFTQLQLWIDQLKKRDRNVTTDKTFFSDLSPVHIYFIFSIGEVSQLLIDSKGPHYKKWCPPKTPCQSLSRPTPFLSFWLTHTTHLKRNMVSFTNLPKLYKNIWLVLSQLKRNLVFLPRLLLLRT